MPHAHHRPCATRLLGRALALTAVVTIAVAAPAWAKTWSGETLPSGLGVLSGISCVKHSVKHKKTERCVAVGQDTAKKLGAIVVSNDGGKTWGSMAVPAGIGGLFGVSCASFSRCVAAGETDAADGFHAATVATTDGGKNWFRQQLPAGHQAIGWISCRSDRCVAGGLRWGNTLLVTSDGGTSWSPKTLPLHAGCTGFCVAYAEDSGTLASKSTGYAVGGNQCGGANVTQCPGVIWKSTNGGDSWKLVFEGQPFVDAISCVDSSHCWAAAATFKTGVMLRSANGGKSWKRQTLPSFSGFFNSISCVRASKADRCLAVGQNAAGTAPVIAATSDGGSHWKLDTAPSDTGALFGVDVVGHGGRAVGQDPTATSARAIGR
jgi:photosystem II stability/assembly factor-like uncharacterized protein